MSDTELQLLRVELKRWEIPDAIFKAVPATLANILLNGTNAEKIAAAKVIASIHQQNLDANPNPKLHAHQHIHQVVPATAEDFDRKRQELLARIARLG